LTFTRQYLPAFFDPGGGGLKVDQARRLEELKRENQRLKKAVSELTPVDPEGST
jgi:arginase family enzyme